MSSRRVVVAPLDWGLGHATRCIPVIKELLQRNCEVFLAGSGSSLDLLKNEFPALEHIELAAYSPVYSATSSQATKMALQMGKFLTAIAREHRQLERFVKEKSIEIIISDNRYGCWSAVAISVFITHQLNIQMPRGLKWLSNTINHFNHHKIKKFSLCWIPDIPGINSLTGDLSVAPLQNTQYIGWLSRFTHVFNNAPKEYDVAAVLSGPEPQRSILEEILLEQLLKSGLRCVLVRGTGTVGRSKMINNVERIDFLNSTGLQQVLEKSEIILARPGYSTIMDLSELNKKAIFIPTPGQTEQEYLAKRLFESGIAFFMNQSVFNLQEAMKRSVNYTGFKNFSQHENLLRKVLDELLS